MANDERKTGCCKYCFGKERWQGDNAHYEGCPTTSQDEVLARIWWNIGYNKGLGSNSKPLSDALLNGRHKASLILGYNVGKAEILVREKADFEAGYAYGFDDNNIQWHHRDGYTPAFLRGHREGKAKIDELVEDAIEARNNYGDWW